MSRRPELVAELRSRIEAPELSDDELLAACEGTLSMALAELAIAWRPIYQSIQQELDRLAGWLSRLIR